MSGGANDPFLQDLQATPVTGATCALLCIICFYIWNNRVPVDKVAFSYAKVVKEGEWWRMLTGSHSHMEIFHLGFNVMSLWSCRIAELVLGPWVFFVQSLTLAIVCKLLMLGTIYLVTSRFPAQQARAWQEQMSVGYSAVIFAWMTIVSSYTPNATVSVFGLIDVPSQLTPIVSLVITHILVRNASFIGHASGIVAGVFTVFGLLDWLQQFYWSVSWLIWVAAATAYSLKATMPAIPIPCIDYISSRESQTQPFTGRGFSLQPQQPQPQSHYQNGGGNGGNGGNGGVGASSGPTLV